MEYYKNLSEGRVLNIEQLFKPNLKVKEAKEIIKNATGIDEKIKDIKY